MYQAVRVSTRVAAGPAFAYTRDMIVAPLQVGLAEYAASFHG